MVTRKKLETDSDILRAARRKIEENKTSCVCTAIGMVCKRRLLVRGNRLMGWVMEMLGNHSFYSTWLLDKHPAFYHRQYQRWRMAGRQESPWKAGRLAWLDWMIGECEKAEAQHG